MQTKFLSLISIFALSTSSVAIAKEDSTVENIQQKLDEKAMIEKEAARRKAEENASMDSSKKEKCFGLAKAGKNDCAAVSGAHACAGYSKFDASPAEWILLPAGTCNRIVGGSLTPGADPNQKKKEDKDEDG
jgi:uncharacterized membrane protein